MDKYNRVRLPEAKPGQVYSKHVNADGSVLLVPVKQVERKAERFPPGSLLKYFSGELGRKRDQEEAAIASGCAQG